MGVHAAHVGIVRVVDTAGQSPRDGRVVGEFINASPRSLAAAPEMLNEFDVAVVQHEYGLYGGTDGDEVLEILGALHVPSIVIAHTILTNPTPHQWSVLND